MDAAHTQVYADLRDMGDKLQRLLARVRGDEKLPLPEDTVSHVVEAKEALFAAQRSMERRLR